MGAIIANDIIRYFPNLPYKDIVYMAAASSISHVQETVVPLLSRPGNKVSFYNLMLHPDADSREQTLGGIGPTGSLLEWIDDYYTDPSTMVDRRFGKWRNLFYIRTMIPKKAREHMTFKVFGFTRKLNNPMRHGDFSGTDQCYWGLSSGERRFTGGKATRSAVTRFGRNHPGTDCRASEKFQGWSMDFTTDMSIMRGLPA